MLQIGIIPMIDIPTPHNILNGILKVILHLTDFPNGLTQLIPVLWQSAIDLLPQDGVLIIFVGL
jgi:hypothetical protein